MSVGHRSDEQSTVGVASNSGRVDETAPASDPGHWELCVLFDGECPLCAAEIRMLRSLDRGRGRIHFDDIAAPEFRAERYGTDHASLMARIHAALPDGTLVEGVEVFRRAYAAVGLGWLVAPTRWPLLGPLTDALYRVFARNRLAITGRGATCDSDRCTPVNR